MSRNLRRVLLPTLAGALMLSSLPLLADAGSGCTRGVKVSTTPTTPTKDSFSSSELEYYLTDDGIAYIRPGVKLTIIAITNYGRRKEAGRRVHTHRQLRPAARPPRQGDAGPDRAGLHLLALGCGSPLLLRAHHAHAQRRDATRRPTRAARTPTSPSATTSTRSARRCRRPRRDARRYTLGAYARRTLTDIIGKDYYADNVFKDFRVDGAAVTSAWGAMSDVSETCNKCHDPSACTAARAASRRCACSATTTRSRRTRRRNETFNGKVFFHKLHRGENLPSVVAGGTYYAGGDWSTVAYPQDIRNCTTCHDTAAKEKDIWYTRPNRDACGSCHDDINWVTGENHVGGKQLDDSACASCHQPESELEFDASIKGAHTVPEKSKQLKGITATITSASNMTPGKKPTVVFTIKNGDGTAVDGTKLATFSPKSRRPDHELLEVLP